MALVERIVGELFDFVEDIFAQGYAVARRLTAGDEVLAFILHGLAVLLAAGPAQFVGVCQRVGGELLRHAHDRLLVDHQPKGVGEKLLGIGVEVGNRLSAVLAIGVVVVHVRGHRARPVQGNERCNILETGRSERSHEGAHRPRLELEHADRVATRQKVEGGLIVERHLVDVDGLAPGGLDEGQGVGDDVQVPESQEVHLEESEVLDGVHLVLGDHRRIAGILTGFGLPLDGEVVRQGLLGDHHGGGVDAVLAPEALESPGHVDDLAHVAVVSVHLAQVGGHLEAVGVLLGLLEAGGKRGVAAHDQWRHRLGDPVAHAIRVSEHPGGIADGGPSLDLRERDDLGDMVPAVAFGRVADDLVPVAGIEVHVDVRHVAPARVQEALEQQVVPDGVQVGDLEGVGHGTTRSTAPAGADPDAPVPRVPDDVPGDEEVRGEAHVSDDLQLVGQTIDDGVGERVAPPLPGALERQVLEVGVVVGEALGQREIGELRLAELDLDVAAFGDQERVVARRRNLTKEVTHLAGGLHVVLGAVEPEPLLVAHQRAGLHAQQCVVRHRIVLAGVVAVVRGQQRRTQLLRQADELRVGALLLGNAVVLEFDEQVVPAEDVLEAPGPLPGPFVVVGEERLEDLAAETARGGDEPLAVVGENLPVDPGLVVVALEERPAGYLDQVPIAGGILGQEGQVVVELAPALGLTAGVVESATAGGSFAARLVRHVRLGAQHRLDSLLPALPVEVDDPVHVAVIGDADRRLAVRDRSRHDVLDPGRSVQQRILGVDVEVAEGIGHGTRGPTQRYVPGRASTPGGAWPEVNSPRRIPSNCCWAAIC